MHHNKKNYLFSSESVADGHPDKVCDQISDNILDAFLKKDPYAKVACESFAMKNRVIIGGEYRSSAEMTNKEIELVVRNTIKNIGYQEENFHFDKVKVDIMLNQQSPDIAMGVDETENKFEGAGDQGIMFGYACNETEELMPATIMYSHKILRNIRTAIKDGKLHGLKSDAKSQVTLAYEDGVPVKATALVVSIHHVEDLSQKQVSDLVIPYIEQTLPKGFIDAKTKIFINPTGRFVVGGPESDVGLTGRKIIVDTYGGAAPHGGGAFSGKDPTKVDRSAAYIARYLAKNVVASGIASRSTIQLSYAIGVSYPLSFYINNHGTSNVGEDEIAKFLQENIDLTPKGIREYLKLNNPIYSQTACYGHFGRVAEGDFFSWEKTDLAGLIAKKFG